jgi:hypothetical protein
VPPLGMMTNLDWLTHRRQASLRQLISALALLAGGLGPLLQALAAGFLALFVAVHGAVLFYRAKARAMVVWVMSRSVISRPANW